MLRGMAWTLGLVVVVASVSACGGNEPPEAASVSPEVVAGEELAQSLGCSACHSVNGSRRTGPTWLGLYGEDVTLKDGTTVVADDTYVRRSIDDPAVDVVEGFSPIMPQFDLSQDELAALTAYIRSLGTK